MQRNLNLSMSVTNLALTGIETNDREFRTESHFFISESVGAEIKDGTLYLNICITDADWLRELLTKAISDTQTMLKAGLQAA